MSPTITIFNADGSEVVLTVENTKEVFDFLGLSRTYHSTLWIKFAANVPEVDEEIIDNYHAALHLGFRRKEK